ncbi:MAG: hypothetical protein HGB11_05835 [Chlorobiales bacterium]|nr:hypothetical protein [Chlorobiales bacterium]
MRLITTTSLILLFLFSPNRTFGGNENTPVIQFAKPDRAQSVYRYNLKTIGQMATRPFNPDTLRRLRFTEEELGPKLFSELTDGNDVTSYDAKSVQSFIDNYYLSYRGFYPKLSDIADKWRYKSPELWIRMDVNSDVMQGRREIYINKKSLFLALLKFKKNGNKIIYAPGTIFLSETYRLNKKQRKDEFANAEMIIKREDGEWDFFLYDSYQRITTNPIAESKTGVAPHGCLKCHSAKVQQEPFKSFPKNASKTYSVSLGSDYYNADVFKFLGESRVKTDYVMAPYASMFLSKLIADARQSKLTREDQFIYQNLKPVLPEVLGK